MSILRKTLITSFAAGILFTNLNAQTLFTYGTQAVSKDEFLKAYLKNNAAEEATAENYRNYLDLYTRFKLKVKAARDLRLDTLSAQQSELQAFKMQVADNYMDDAATIDKLVAEAHERRKKEIRLAHIFIPVAAGATEADVKLANDKIQTAYKRLASGEAFESVAMIFSADPSVSVNKGEIGFITALTLNYELENLAYTTPVGTVSKPTRSQIGFHIFKSLGERPSSGRMRAAQILLAFTPGMTSAMKQELKRLADSLHKVLIDGGDFKTLAAQFSSDNLTYQAGGEMMEFGAGTYEPDFETAAFALQNDGDISTPVLSSFGYHIIKRLARKPVADSLNDAREKDALRQLVFQSDRMQIARTAQLERIRTQVGFKKTAYNEKALWALSDATLLQAAPGSTVSTPAKTGTGAGLADGTVLFTYGNKKVTVKNWLDHLRQLRVAGPVTTSQKKYQDFIDLRITEYYRENLEQYNKEFAFQLNEFREGNLLFEIMQRNIWDKAAADSVGLKKYYDKNQDKYKWEASAEAIIFTFINNTVADSMRSVIESNWKSWAQLAENSEGQMQADSARFELSQLPVPDRTNFQPGLLTANTKNETDQSVSYSYVIKMYPGNEQRDFASARGFVINDYQSYLEEAWIKELKKKYPVKVNEQVLSGL